MNFGSNTSRLRFWLAWYLGSILTGCAPADYSDGVSNFSQAVTAANTAEQSLITAERQARLNEWAQKALRSPTQQVSVDLAKCHAQFGDYHAGDCAVTWRGAPAPAAPRQSSFEHLIKYAALLSAVTADKTCASVQSDAQSLATSLGDLAKDAKATGLASAAGPVSTVVSVLACLSVQAAQLSVLRVSTSEANPIIQDLIPIVVSKDATMYRIVLDDNVRQLQSAVLGYSQTRSASDLASIVSLAAAIDSAELNPPGPAIAKIAPLHEALTADLKAPTVSLKRVENDAQALIDQIQTVTDSLQRLQSSGSNATSSSAIK